LGSAGDLARRGRRLAPGNWTQLNKQVTQAKALMRQMRRTVEDIEDARTIERAKRAKRNKQIQ